MSQSDQPSPWKLRQPQQLLAAINSLANTSKLADFLRDVLTEKEIFEISARFEAAQLLMNGASYDTIATQTKLSTRTIARISQWLKSGTNGYSAAIKAISKPELEPTKAAHHSHIPPARAE